jgi:predicted transposase YbfD/YdcC
VAVEPGSNEPAALPRLLEVLRLEGAMVTSDAVGYQPGLARQIVEPGANYVLARKDHQLTLRQDVAQVFAAAQASGYAEIAHDRHRTVEQGHGRLEIRERWTIPDPAYRAWLDEAGTWAGLRSVGMGIAERRSGSR